ncbi:MAG: hypothetical protein ABSC95_13260 [Acetobacteraceae bacterium]|jgi:uncharacterized protein (DUF39 family)
MLIVPMLGWATGQATQDAATAAALMLTADLRSVEPRNAFAAFDVKDGPWRDRDLYVAVQVSHGVLVAHGSPPSA